MTMRNVTEAKAELSALLVLVENGEEVIISRAGKPIAKLTRLDAYTERRKPGQLKGQIWISDDFDSLGDELTRDFFGDASE